MVQTASNAELASDSDLNWEDGLEYDLASPSDIVVFMQQEEGLWDHWTSTDFKFLDGTNGDGTAGRPYQIRTKAHLMALSQLASLGMMIREGDLERDTYVGDYKGASFELMENINLAGMNWLPIGFYRDKDEMAGPVINPFVGNFDGNGYTISNFRISDSAFNYAGLFGSIKDSSITDLSVQLSDSFYGGDRIGILAGYAQGRIQIRNCSVKGNVRGKGIVGGLIGYLSGDGGEASVIEDCKADVTLDSERPVSGTQVCVGGIAGQADFSTIADCEVETAGNATARIQGKGYVGGIIGFQNHTDLYHVLVSSGTVGGNGSEAIGGITGYYIAGDIKVARMQGMIGSSGLGSYAHEGIFVGNKGSGCNFTYGTKAADDFAYLFTDTEAKINIGVCGSDVADDNSYTYEDHVGFWHGGDLYFTLCQGNKTKAVTNRYFYEELEQGVLSVMDEEINGREVPFTINHVVPDSTGRPKRGYLISIPQIDTVANGRNFYHVAVLTATGNGAYYKLLDRDHRGAVAAGTTVTVATSPRNTDTEKYQMEGSPVYKKGGVQQTATYVKGGAYTFTMPENDTELTARYKRVAANVQVMPAEYSFRVVQTRTGSRKAPTLTTVVTGNSGNEIARYVGRELAEVQVQPVYIQKSVDTHDDVEDSRVLWSADDPDLIRLLDNDDRDAAGYTDKSASIQVNLGGDFFQSIIREAEQRQRENGYQYVIPSTIYGAGYAGGGVGILTASTRPSESFDGKPCTAQCRVKVTFQIQDRTYVDLESVALDQPVELRIVRTLSGNRNRPVENVEVTSACTVNALCNPSYFSFKNVAWTLDDLSAVSVERDPGSPYSVRIRALPDAQWIREIKESNAQNPANAKGDWETRITVKVEDMNGNMKTASAKIRVTYETQDRTGGGSGGGGGGGGGGSSTGVTPSGTTRGLGITAPGAVTGTWIQDAAGQWLFADQERTFADEWAYIHNPYALAGQETAAWFRFDERGHMVTGWYTDAFGNTYFLHNRPDGNQGMMYRGWNWVGDACYFFHPVADGAQGRLLKSAVTPDGYTVDESGRWVMEEVVQAPADNGGIK